MPTAECLMQTRQIHMYSHTGSCPEDTGQSGTVRKHAERLKQVWLLHIFYVTQEQAPGTQVNVEERMNNLFEDLQKRMEKRRSLGAFMLTIPGATSIACQV